MKNNSKSNYQFSGPCEGKEIYGNMHASINLMTSKIGASLDSHMRERLACEPL